MTDSSLPSGSPDLPSNLPSDIPPFPEEIILDPSSIPPPTERDLIPGGDPLAAGDMISFSDPIPGLTSKESHFVIQRSLVAKMFLRVPTAKKLLSDNSSENMSKDSPALISQVLMFSDDGGRTWQDLETAIFTGLVEEVKEANDG